jgi:alpha-tubulin suppressor-like RCC1 family protein
MVSFADELRPQLVSVPAGAIERGVLTFVSVYAPEMKSLAVSEIAFSNGGAKLVLRVGARAGSTGSLPFTRTLIAAAQNRSIAAGADGSVWTWGDNSAGLLGDDGSTHRSTPVAVQRLSDAVAVAAGDAGTEGARSVALRGDGTVWAWGGNASGQLGDGTNDDRSTPVQVSGRHGVVAIATGAGSTTRASAVTETTQSDSCHTA